MRDFFNTKKGLKAYCIGFVIGAIIGIYIWFFIGKTISVSPIYLGIIGGAIGHKQKRKKDERANK